MDIEIELRFAAAAYHEFRVATNLLRAFGAVLAADNRFVPHVSEYLTPGSRNRAIRLHGFDDGIHLSIVITKVFQN
jgi:hypothetical protein